MSMDRRRTLEEYGDYKRKRDVDIDAVHLNRKVTAISYSVELTLDDYDKMTTYEMEMGLGDICLNEILEEITNAYQVDYNGHFGCYIFFSLEPQDDNELNWKLIETIINGQIQKAREFELPND